MSERLSLLSFADWRALPHGRATAPSVPRLLLNLLQNPVSVIAGDQWNVFVRAQLF
jgi:hypothetical protein